MTRFCSLPVLVIVGARLNERGGRGGEKKERPRGRGTKDPTKGRTEEPGGLSVRCFVAGGGALEDAVLAGLGKGVVGVVFAASFFAIALTAIAPPDQLRSQSAPRAWGAIRDARTWAIH
jgi:hypothetical protein